jgi:hypothetical protein
MPVMKECAFIVLFACDYVNSRYMTVWCGEAAGSCPALVTGAMGIHREGPSFERGTQV